MFNFNPSPTFKALVPLSVPGQAEPLEVEFEFRHQTKTAMDKWLAKGGISAEEQHQVLAGWSMRADGKPVELTVTALAELHENYPASALEIVDCYIREMLKAKRKN